MNPNAYRDQLGLHGLPTQAASLLSQLSAPPRLLAHAILVHDVAHQLANALMANWPNLALDRDQVAFGATLHDIGKIHYPEELSGPGHLHEAAGQALLLAAGIDAQLARFCITHAAWRTQNLTLEDLLVALADTCWKGKRQQALEQQVISHIQAQYPEQAWAILLFVDELVEGLAAHADQRLAWQAQFPTSN
ncbi:HD domain-containing protein [Herpetosiphon llansteffanensis]